MRQCTWLGCSVSRRADDQLGDLGEVPRAFWEPLLAPPLYNPNDSGEAENEYRDARHQNNQPGRRYRNLIVSDMQDHSPNMRSEFRLFQHVGLPQSNSRFERAVDVVAKSPPQHETNGKKSPKQKKEQKS